MGITAGIPTVYAGVQMRSRLEATWAALFDALEWKWEYEPFDANGYIPDFVVLGDAPLLVDIKPLQDTETLTQRATEVAKLIDGFWNEDYLCLGLTPFPTESYLTSCLGAAVIGEPYPSEDDDDSSYFSDTAVWVSCLSCDTINLISASGSWKCRPCGHYEGNAGFIVADETPIREAWTTAKNAVRWNPKAVT